MCICMSSLVRQFSRLACIGTCVHPVHMVVLLCTFLWLYNLRSSLMKGLQAWWNWRPRGRTERDKRKNSNWRTEEIHDMENRKGVFFMRRHVSFWVTGPNHRTGQEGHGSCSECYPVLPCHLRGEKKSCYPDITESFSPEGRYNRIQQGPEPVPSASGMRDIAAYPVPPAADGPSALPSPASSPSSSQ